MPKLLAFAASLRRGSWNRKLVRLAADIARRGGAEVDLADFHEFDMPLHDADLQAASGIPSGAEELGRRIVAADGVMIASPEYNFSLPGTLKNAIDWVSRQLRIPLEALGVLVLPDMYTLPWAEKAFAPDGQLNEQERQDRLAAMVQRYLEVARKLAAG